MSNDVLGLCIRKIKHQTMSALQFFGAAAIVIEIFHDKIYSELRAHV